MKQKEKDFLYGKRSFGKNRSVITVEAKVSRFGKKKVMAKGNRETWIKTLCLSDIKDLKGNRLADHLWVDFPFDMKLKVNDNVRVTGQVREYTKLDDLFGGYRNNYEIYNIKSVDILK